MTENTKQNQDIVSLVDKKIAIIEPKDYQVGTVVADSLISNIIKRGSNFAIYEVEGRRSFGYSAIGLNLEQQEFINRIDRLRAKSINKLKGTPNNEVENLFTGLLGNVFTKQKSELIETSITEAEKFINSLSEVETVIANTSSYIIWINNKNEIRLEIERKKGEECRQRIDEFNRVETLANALLSDDHLKHFNKRLGAALAESISLDSTSDFKAVFKPLEKYIQSVISNGVRIKYLIATSVISILLTVITYAIQQGIVLQEFLNHALIVVAGGFLGTFISVFERSKSLLIDDCDSTSLIILQGILRVVLGGIFGLIAYSAATTGLAFSIFKDSVASLILLGIAAGFSERLIPELIQGFSSDQKSENESISE